MTRRQTQKFISGTAQYFGITHVREANRGKDLASHMSDRQNLD